MMLSYVWIRNDKEATQSNKDERGESWLRNIIKIPSALHGMIVLVRSKTPSSYDMIQESTLAKK